MKKLLLSATTMAAIALAAATPANAQPANDTCAGAIQVFDGNNTVDNTGATQDTLLPEACIGFNSESSFTYYPVTNSGVDTWYFYTAPVTGIRNFEITASNLGFLSIYDSCNGQLLACNAYGGQEEGPKIYHFPITSGTTYYIRYALFGTSQRARTLQIYDPPTAVNQVDDCVMATAVAGEGTIAFTTAGLTDSDVLPWDCDYMFKDGWFAWTPSVSGRGVVGACTTGTGLSSLRLALYDACGGVPLVCADGAAFQDPPNAFCSNKFAYDVVAGQTYYIRFGRIFPNSGIVSGDMLFEVRTQSTTYEPPFDAITEAETCDEVVDTPPWSNDPNAGCGATPHLFTSINVGETYAGTTTGRVLPVNASTAGYAVPSPDLDWYEFTLTCDTAITIIGQSEFQPRAAIRKNCPHTNVASVPFWSNSVEGVYSLNVQTGVLTAGTYSFFIAPGNYYEAATSCGNRNRYWFNISTDVQCPPPCAADFNGVNGVTVQDIFDFLTAWLAGNASADFNGVNGVTVQDIFDFLTAWLAGC